MGGGGSSPDIEEIPEKQATKSLSAGANAAVQAQKERARRNLGLAASILTTRSGLAGTATGNRTLG